MKIFFLVPYTPTRIRTRPYNLIKALLASGHDLTVATLWSDPSELEDFRELIGNRRRPVLQQLTKYRSLWNCLKSLPGKDPLQAAYSWTPVMSELLGDLIATQDYDVVHVEHLRGARYALLLQELLSRHGKTTPVVWDSVDCISGLFEQAAQGSARWTSRTIAKLELGRTRRFEAMLVKQFSRVLVTSALDRKQLLELAADDDTSDPPSPLQERVRVLPNGVDLDYFTAANEEREKATLVISGKMSYHANVAAVVNFVKEVLPRIWAQRPDVRLWVTGKDPSRTILELASDRVEVTGTVRDIRPFLQRATIAVAPIQYGAGIQNKVLEAMACATPVIASPTAVGALSAKPGLHLAVADGPEEFARTTLALLKNEKLRRAQGEAGRRYVEENHDWGSIVDDLECIYREACIEKRHIPAVSTTVNHFGQEKEKIDVS
ncbi:MAG TPA: glycosyltransferase [Acidobacteriota bacterium]|nr:glycosyltransferase [Acidobacteriota bacterium]